MNNAENEILVMTFTPNTIQHLGVRMYSTLPPVLAELIANSYDADASEVHIHLKDIAEKQIEVIDNGHGMTFDEINNKFLRIGRNRRNDESRQTSPNGRKVIGKKGLGKLSFFGIAHEIVVCTVKNEKRNIFTMKWEDILSSEDSNNKQQDYKPTIIEHDIDCSDANGTKITLKSIQRASDFDANALADNLSKIFIMDQDFKIYIKHNFNHEILINNDRKYALLNTQIKWKVPEDIELESNYEKANEVKGQLIATEKPLSPNTNLRGITLFSRRKLVNAPEYFSDSTSSHVFSYLTGWLEVDFIDDLDEDVIGTNRQSLNWLHPEMVKLHDYLQKMLNWISRDWSKKRGEIRKEKISEATGIDIPDWYKKLPEDIRNKVEPIVEAIVKDTELSTQEGSSAVKNFHEIVPEYPRFHWRHLNNNVKSASETDYEREDYYRAFLEAAKRYINEVRNKSKCENTSDGSMMGEVFGKNTHYLSVANNFKKTDGNEFQSTTIENIEEGQKLLSMGIVTGCRNPVSHEEIIDLKNSGLFTESDCLDALSTLSHLFRRLENSKIKQKKE